MAKWIERLVQLLTGTVTGLMAIMTTILISNIFCRYVFGFSLTWSAEAARYCMVWFAFLGIAVLAHRREHLSVKFLESRLKPRLQKAIQGTILLGSAVFFVILSGFGGILVVRTQGQTAASIPWLPINLVYTVIPVSGIVMTLSTLHEIVGLFRNTGNDT